MSVSDFANMGLTTLADMATVFCGDLIAHGSQRSVYSCRLDPSLVVKVETNSRSFQNIEEHATWEMIKETKHAQWFAPVASISSCGIVLLMKRTYPGPAFAYPNKVPAYFTDMKYKNFGWLGQNLVCHDYGFNLMRNTGLTKRMRQADWWSSP